MTHLTALDICVLALTFSMIGNALLWFSQLRINRHAAKLFQLLGEQTGLADRTTNR